MNEGANECIESQAEQPCGPPRGALAAGAGPSCWGDRVQVRPESKAGLSSRAALNPADTEDFGSPAADTRAAAVHLTSCLGRRLVWASATPGSPHGGPACRFSEHGLDAQRPHGILAVPSVPTAQRGPLRSWWLRWSAAWAGGRAGGGGGAAPGALVSHRASPSSAMWPWPRRAPCPVSCLRLRSLFGTRSPPRPRGRRACSPLCVSRLDRGGPGRFPEAGGGWACELSRHGAQASGLRGNLGSGSLCPEGQRAECSP